MAIPISNVTRRVVYEADGTGPYAFTFEILANTDIAVYKDDALLTLTTDYTVTIASNGTGSITLVASPTGADQIAIVGNRTIQRTTDFVTGGDFFANTVNDEMDQQTIFAQQNAEGLTRALQAPQTDPTTIDMTLPRASVRANKTLAFDTDGNPTTGEAIGDNRGNWASGTVYNKRDIVKDTSNGNIYYANTSHTSRNSQPISTNADSAKWDLLVDNASAGAAQAAAEAAQDAAETAEANAETAETNAETAATAAASSASAASSSASAASTSATNAASSASTASTAATNASNSATAAATSATNASNSASAASTSASNASSSASSASTSASNASTSATNAASSATTATTKASEASTSATNAASSATASASSATAAAASAAAAAASFDAFDDIYLGAKSSDPSVDNDGNALTTGDQYFNTTANELRVYNGSTWQAASTVGGTVTSLSVTGATTLGQNLAFTGTGNRITGDMSNATVASRVTFQTSTTNGSTIVGAIPNGTGVTSAFRGFNNSDPTNAGQSTIGINSTDMFITSSITGTGTYVPITFGTGGSERMRLDTSGNLGIGTSSPGYKLSITTSTGGGMNMSNGVDSTLRVLLPTTGITYDNVNYGYHAWLVGGSEKIRLDNNGNVGIGTSSPNKSSSSTALTVNTGTAANYSAVEWSSGNTLNYHINANDSAIYHVAAGTRPWIVYTNGSERMRIDSSGNLGIGTSSPSFKLDAQTTATGTAAGDNTAGYFGSQASGRDVNIRFGDSVNATARLGYLSGALYMYTNGAERARIDSSGNLLVGTTNTSPVDSSADGVKIGGTSGSPLNIQGFQKATAAIGRAGTTGTIIDFYYRGASTSGVGYISTNGTSTAYNTSSDYRLKNTIAPMTGALAKIAALKPCTYKWNADGSDGEGFIAHELAEVVPQCVSGEKDAVDADGNPKYQGIDTSFLVATLTAAIQEQQAIITALTARVAALESN